ncbi:MAG: GLPGLI family protein [Flavobacteriaceae bacterium]|nr:GLPGLI family protein [Flavobacteriaceae bacterium]
MKPIITLLLLLFMGPLSAQDFSGQAYYQSKTTVDMDGFGREGMSEDMKKQIMARMKSYLEKTYVLSFNGQESLYSEEVTLDAAGQSRGFGIMMASMEPGMQYKNIGQNQLVEAHEFFGKEFLIKDGLTTLDWEVTKESKVIGQYIAIKATAVKEVKPDEFNLMRRRPDNDDKKDKQEDDSGAQDQAKETTPEDVVMPETVEVTAWFTPQIPIGHGPGEYWGLPGLILELNIDRTTLLCSKIVMNPKNMPEIEAPRKGEVVTQEAFQEIVTKKTQELRANWRGRGGRGSRGGRG